MKYFYSLLLLFIAITGSTQIKDVYKGHHESDDFLNKVVLLRSSDSATYTVGSGVILKKDTTYFIVSAHHVTKYFSDRSSFYISTDVLTMAKNSTKFPLRKFANTRKQFIFNSDSADISIILLNNDSLKKYRVDLINASLSYQYINTELSNQSRAYNLVIAGYPVFNFDFFSPITFNSHVSSTLMPRYDSLMGKKYFIFLIENPSMQGCSGGPVMAGLNGGTTPGKAMLLGIVKGTMYDNTGGKYAGFVPSYYINELVRRIKL